MAYIDYAGDPDEVRSFLKYFEDLPENILLAVAYSMSKSFLVYGMRSGALIGVSSSKTVAEEFANVNTSQTVQPGQTEAVVHRKCWQRLQQIRS